MLRFRFRSFALAALLVGSAALAPHAWADAAEPAATPSPAAAVGTQPYRFGSSMVTPHDPVTQMADVFFGVGIGLNPEMSVPMPLGVGFEVLLPRLAYARARLSYDAGVGIFKLVDSGDTHTGLGGELIAGYPIKSWSGTTDGKWALSSTTTQTTTSTGTQSNVTVSYVEMTLPTQSYLIAEAGVRRNALGLMNRFAADGSVTLLVGARHRWAHHARVVTKSGEDTYDVTADGYSNLWVHALIGHFGSDSTFKPHTTVPNEPVSSVGFEVGWSSAFWLSSPTNLEYSVGNSPSQGWFFLFGMSHRVWTK